MRWFTRETRWVLWARLDNFSSSSSVRRCCFDRHPASARASWGCPNLAGRQLILRLQAHRLARKEGRDDVCALPYGINTVTARIFFCASSSEVDRRRPVGESFAGRVASGGRCHPLIRPHRTGGSFVAERIRKSTRARLCFRRFRELLWVLSVWVSSWTYAYPIVGLTTRNHSAFTSVKCGFGRAGVVAVAVGHNVCLGDAYADEQPAARYCSAFAGSRAERSSEAARSHTGVLRHHSDGAFQLTARFRTSNLRSCRDRYPTAFTRG